MAPINHHTSKVSLSNTENRASCAAKRLKMNPRVPRTRQTTMRRIIRIVWKTMMSKRSSPKMKQPPLAHQETGSQKLHRMMVRARKSILQAIQIRLIILSVSGLKVTAPGVTLIRVTTETRMNQKQRRKRTGPLILWQRINLLPTMQRHRPRHPS